MESDCWLFGGNISNFGYGIVYAYLDGKKKTYRAHRVMYEAMVGEIPEGLVLDHLCRVRSCINPKHLEPVTSRENILRGVNLAAQNLRKTHCKVGHEFTPENTYLKPKGRECLICHRRMTKIWAKKSRDKQKALHQDTHSIN